MTGRVLVWHEPTTAVIDDPNIPLVDGKNGRGVSSTLSKR